jgi:hypothetical protein
MFVSKCAYVNSNVSRGGCSINARRSGTVPPCTRQRSSNADRGFSWHPEADALSIRAKYRRQRWVCQGKGALSRRARPTPSRRPQQPHHPITSIPLGCCILCLLWLILFRRFAELQDGVDGVLAVIRILDEIVDIDPF